MLYHKYIYIYTIFINCRHRPAPSGPTTSKAQLCDGAEKVIPLPRHKFSPSPGPMVLVYIYMLT